MPDIKIVPVQLQADTIDFDNYLKAERLLHVMRPKIRRDVIAYLFHFPKTSVVELSKEFNIHMGVLSRHLTQLRIAGFIQASKNSDNKDGRNNFYDINYSALDGIHNLCRSIIGVVEYTKLTKKQKANA